MCMCGCFTAARQPRRQPVEQTRLPFAQHERGAAAGLGDDLAGALLLAHDWKKPLLFAPAMNPAEKDAATMPTPSADAPM